MEYKSQNATCQNCKKDFTIEPNDFGFYEKIKAPSPTFCPDCRRQRRWAWRNNMSLYSRKCDLCAKSVVSLYSPDSGLTIYCNKCWWSDKWDPFKYGQNYNFSRPFFEQFKELTLKVPHMALINDDSIASVNCEYTNDFAFGKNCYIVFVAWYIENVMYSFHILSGRDMMDCMTIRSESNWIYECILCSKSYQLKYSRVCLACIDSQFLYDCRDCQDCFMCTGLRGKRYNFKNRQYEKEEYEDILSNYKLDTFSGVERAQKEFDDFVLRYPRRHVQIFQSLNCTGDIISISKNTKNSFVVKNSENCKFCDFAGDSSDPNKECYDITMTGGTSESYECVIGDHSQLNRFALFTVKSQDTQYCQHCHNCKYCFGCVGLRDKNYCIFNKQYTKKEYEELVPKITEQMNKIPYIDKTGNIYKYGEYYPIELSYFGYNESCAMEEFPMLKETAIKRGLNWQDNLQRTVGKETLLPENIPDSINDIKDNILEEVLVCIDCGRNYKIVQNELNFYKKMQIPIPHRCFYCRHADRLRKTNPFKLWPRVCMCEKDNHEHGGKCKVKFETSYAPERPEIVYCEKCYQKEVY